MSTHRYYMQRALKAAHSALYNTSPNPRVGCVIVHDGNIIAKAATQVAGGYHAEIVALRQAEEAGFKHLHGATVYVTLEPCSHQGRTPPCVDALIAAQPETVVIAMLDPNPLVAGQGVLKLREAGIKVYFAAEEEFKVAFNLNIGFVARMLRGMPWLWLKTASSLDGRTALLDGHSKWITGAGARADGQRFRARSCVTLTGVNTVLDDNPLLNVRHVDTLRQPIRAVLDSQLRSSPHSKLFDGYAVWLITTVTEVDEEVRAAFLEKNTQIITLPANEEGQVDLGCLMRWFAEQQVNEVHVEAGATLNGAFVQAGYVDALISYIAPMIVGEGRPIAAFPSLSSLEIAPRFELLHSRIIEKDVRLFMRHAQHWRQLYVKLKELQEGVECDVHRDS